MTIDWAHPLQAVTGTIILVVLLLDLVWEMVWKGIALWKAGRNGHKAWFIYILIFNTIGILPIIYILGYSKNNSSAQ